jgi:pimeloyl-ACP methyl ester carboxylesterase
MLTDTIATEAGDIAVVSTANAGPAVLFIHGNSSCKEVFRNQLSAPFAKDFNLIALDLPGHGASSDARVPARDYTMPGYAAMALAVMKALGCDRFTVVGWSLGGHIALEMMAQSAAVERVLITGTPPVSASPESMGAGFLPSEHMLLTGKADFTEDEIDAYARATCGEPFEPFLREAVARTDGRARATMMTSAMSGAGADQKALVETDPRPIAVVSGANEPFVNNAYLQALAWKNLWQGRVHIIEGAGHAPFWEQKEQFNTIVLAFLSGL